MQRARTWCWTLNNYTEEEEAKIQSLECRFVGYGRETGENGTPHLQGFIMFGNAKSFSACKNLLGNRVHLEKARGAPWQAWEYCLKDGDIFQKGFPPVSQQQNGEREKTRWARMLTLARNGQLVTLAEEEPKAYIQYKRTFDQICKENNVATDSLDALDNYWIFGPTGTGKSRGVRKLFGDSLFVKDLNKWWDNYNGEQNVLLDDVDPDSMKYLAKKLKNWADHYPFPAEKKGGSMVIRPKRIIITSNYEPQDCFNYTDLTAINRRFTIKHHVGGELDLEDDLIINDSQ